jgi:S1-C subfamily serine protease
MFTRSYRRTLLLAATGLAAIVAGTGAALARDAASVPALRTGVVDVETNLGLEGGAAAGTGMVLTSSGIVLTNNHVIRGATRVRVLVPSSGRTYNARVLGYSVAADVALLSLQGASKLQTVTIAPSARLRVGQLVTAVGNANGTRRLVLAPGRITGLAKAITATDGQNGSERLTGLIETSTPLQPGDSGGPLFDASQRVIGMNTAASAGFFLTSDESDSYAIPIQRALSIATQIRSGRTSATVHVGATPFIGVQIQPNVGTFGGQSGVAVAGVLNGSPADRAGLTSGVLITALDGKSVGSLKDVSRLLLLKAPGDTVQVSYTDELGNQQTASITLASGPPQ